MRNIQEDKLLKSFGKGIAAIRKDRSMTQQELAEKIDASIVSVGYIETGKRWPRLVTLRKIANALDVPLSVLFQGLK